MLADVPQPCPLGCPPNGRPPPTTQTPALSPHPIQTAAIRAPVGGQLTYVGTIVLSIILVAACLFQWAETFEGDRTLDFHVALYYMIIEANAAYPTPHPSP